MVTSNLIKDCEYYSKINPEELTKYQLMRRICELLSGSYTKSGIRNWFKRPRLKLNGQCPMQAIDTDPQTVYNLAVNCCFGGMGV